MPGNCPNPHYDDEWLRALLSAMREDVRRHQADDVRAHTELHAKLDTLTTQMEDFKRTLATVSTIARVLRWAIGIAMSAGGIGWATGWIGHKFHLN